MSLYQQQQVKKKILGQAYSSDAQTVFAFMTGLVTAEKDAMSVFIDACVAKLNWKVTCMDDFAEMGLQLESNSLIKWLT